MKMLAEQRTRSSEKTSTYGSCKENTETSGSNKCREEEAEKNREKSDSENSWKEEGRGEDGSSKEDEDSEVSKEKWSRINKTLETNMATATAQLGTNSKDEDENSSSSGDEQFNKDNMTGFMGDHELSMEDFNQEASEVSSGIFDAAYRQKYKEPTNFLQSLWNVAGPSVASMLTQLDLIKTKLKGNEAGVEPDFSWIDTQLIDFLIEEAGGETPNCIAFIDAISAKLNRYKEKDEMEFKMTQSDTLEGRSEEEALTQVEGGGTSAASKTQGMLPRAPEGSPAEGAANGTDTEMSDGDKEGAQSVSMAQVE
jgi:hypothetical protein